MSEEAIEIAVEYRDSLGRKSIDFETDDFIKKYKELRKENSVFRTLNGKSFYVKNRNGIQEKETNRMEERICKALFNKYNAASSDRMFINSSEHYILDYQLPLKNVRGDNGWGKIDLLSIDVNDKRFCFWEVKHSKKNKRSHCTFQYSLFELLIYFSQFDRNCPEPKKQNVKNNFEKLQKEFEENTRLLQGTDDFHKNPPKLVVAANKGYFDNLMKYKSKYQSLIEKISEDLKIEVILLEYENDDLKHDKSQKKDIIENVIFKELDLSE